MSVLSRVSILTLSVLVGLSGVWAEDAAKKPLRKPKPAATETPEFSPERIRAVIAKSNGKTVLADPIVTGTPKRKLTTGTIAPQAKPVVAQGLPDDKRAVVPPVKSASEEPVFGPNAYARILAAHKSYEAIEAAGGWPETPAAVMTLRKGSRHPLALVLRQRLAMTGDLAEDKVDAAILDDDLQAALRRFQARHGLTRTGLVGKLTLKALNVPVSTRINQLAASAHRLYGNGFAFSDRYVVVNIPGAAVEAVENGFVRQRYAAVVGRPDRPSPVIQARITSINLNPIWTAPNTVLQKDIADKVLANPAFLAENGMRLVDFKNNPIDPATIDWKALKSLKKVDFLLKQDPGPLNALGSVKIDMPNKLAVYLHDTPKKDLFRADLRFNSSGCARVEGVHDLAAWLLEPTGIARDELDARIQFGDTSQIKLKSGVPVAWIYLTGWGDPDGTVQFRDDIYGLDTYEGIAQTTIKARVTPPPATRVSAKKNNLAATTPGAR
jgi:L,D-transpeptidase YcbB